jgi:hypothetical protein
MSATQSYLAIFTGSPGNPRMKAWLALSDAKRETKREEGVVAWKAWMERHKSAVVGAGGPLGRTKRVNGEGVEDVANEMTAYVIVRADSHEAAARLFESHPHFAIFPGEAIEVMPVLPTPQG